MTKTIFTNAKLADGTLHDIHVENGRITGIQPATEASASGIVVDIAGDLLVPGFVEGHIHLDTSFYGGKWVPHRPCTNGFDVHERVAFQAENMAKAEPMAERAIKQLELCVSHGTLQMRSHVMVDGSIGLKSLETILAVREQYRDVIDIQLVAFPQSGILKSPGTPELLDEAIGLGADLIGGLDPASFDRDVSANLDVVFGIAEKRGVDADIHLHEGGTMGAFTIEEICARTEALGMQGHVSISHAYGLGDLPVDAARKIAARIARSGISIMTNAPGHHSFPPVALLRSEGVNVFSGSDNIRDSWWPYGDGDMLRRAEIIGYRSGFFTDAELQAAFDIVTTAGAKALRLDGYGIEVGAKADFVAIAAEHVAEAVVGFPGNRKVFKQGRLVADQGQVRQK
ncbi:amidohydrolase family protein [Aliirhizobium cellulosilyticum]|uniref:Cytosine deaminase n=1 Tax=Aliirhizobium cellulosilyticum TaxID=393664 RepID=A0A7W6XBR4_9HYPH|nr:amidohydrolase family protein [Rhizobium cellulosilyticum]MBB4349595.1 cytosine deaminase [Rhizobium cellulosilyticum]MBB4412183.1 cytosine deaminase [Rhizobium cellulosilyticum]MBB4446814.1 cytosine deaminase [Rhizobium cellulosilyticum]